MGGEDLPALAVLMPAHNMTAAEARDALAAFETHGSQLAAARALGISRTTFQSRFWRAQIMRDRGEITDGPAPASPLPPLLCFEDAWQQWRTAIGMAKDRYTPSTRRRNVSTTQKFLVVPDLHAPFHETQMFADMLTREADADRVICIGDVGDSYALSRFEKYERMPYREEWASVTLCMQELASRFPRVDIVLGNHDVRLERQLRQRLTEDMVDAIGFITGGVLCPITAIAKRYPNVHIAKHDTPSGHSVDWFMTVGDAWFGHPERFSKVPGSVLRGVEDWLTDNEQALGLERYRLIVCGHTHAALVMPWRANQLLVECGTLAKTQGYMVSPRMGGRPQRRGYVTFVQTDGVTDLNSVKFTWLDV